jgi:hypothetical protein
MRLAGKAKRSTWNANLPTRFFYFQPAIQIVFGDSKKPNYDDFLMFEPPRGGAAGIVGSDHAGDHWTPLWGSLSII